MNQTGRSRALSLVVVLAVLIAPVLGAAIYVGAARESYSRHEPVSTSDTESPTQGGGWARLAASTLDGGSFSMADLAGKPTILYLWATWCPQCRVQREVLSTLSRDWGDRVRMVALTVDDEIPPVKRYLKTHSSLSHELRASSELLGFFEVEALPTLVVIDGKGRVQSVSSGLTGADGLRRVVAPLLP